MMLSCNPAGDVESQAGTLSDTFCGEKGIEDSGLDFRGDTWSVVRDLNRDAVEI